jgi:hypothetical protein
MTFVQEPPDPPAGQTVAYIAGELVLVPTDKLWLVPQVEASIHSKKIVLVGKGSYAGEAQGVLELKKKRGKYYHEVVVWSPRGKTFSSLNWETCTGIIGMHRQK